MYYIQKADKPKFYEEKLNIVKIKDNKILLPIKNNNKDGKIFYKIISEKKQIKLAEKINKLLLKANSNKLVISKEIQKLVLLVNKLYSYNYNIVKGKKLFEAITCIILEYICKKNDLKKQETKISILVNNISDYTLQNIKKIATEYKTLNIVTNHIEKFKKLEDIIYNESGLMVTVSNNKKKSLIKTDIIINVDFLEELLNKYNIKDEAIIININDDIRINKKRFNGLIINDYEISVKESLINEIDRKEYYVKELYEAQIYDGIPYKDLMKKIKDDNVEVSALYGINGKIF